MAYYDLLAQSHLMQALRRDSETASPDNLVNPYPVSFMLIQKPLPSCYLVVGLILLADSGHCSKQTWS